MVIGLYIIFTLDRTKKYKGISWKETTRQEFIVKIISKVGSEDIPYAPK